MATPNASAAIPLIRNLWPASDALLPPTQPEQTFAAPPPQAAFAPAMPDHITYAALRALLGNRPGDVR